MRGKFYPAHTKRAERRRPPPHAAAGRGVFDSIFTRFACTIVFLLP